MIKILSASQIRELDAFTIANEPVQSIELMERACRAFVQWFAGISDATRKTGIVCGTGNNGGDGLGIARLLNDWGYPVKVWIVRGPVPESEDFRKNLDRIKGKIEIFEITTEADRGLFTGMDVIVDAIFGSGLSRPVEGIYAQAIRCINQTQAMKVAVDIPSGLMADRHTEGDTVRADYTVSFQLPKLSFFLPQSYAFTGEWVVVDIGLSRKFIRDLGASYYYMVRKGAGRLVKKRSKFDHKGTFGHALLISGSYGKMGACVLASRALLRSGAGLLTVHAPGCGYTIMQTAVPEAMFSADENETVFSSVTDVEKYTTIGIGPGLGQHPLTVSGIRRLLEGFQKPMVIDADALNILSANPALLHSIPAGSILTPHPKEFERLAGGWSNDFERLEKQQEMAAKMKCVVVVKGAHTAVALPSGDVYFNSTGNPGMATGGTGDVLTGILTGLLAQSYGPEDAARLGVFLHGLAGDLAKIEKGEESLIPSDLNDFLPQAFRKIKG